MESLDDALENSTRRLDALIASEPGTRAPWFDEALERAKREVIRDRLARNLLAFETLLRAMQLLYAKLCDVTTMVFVVDELSGLAASGTAKPDVLKADRLNGPVISEKE